MGVLEESQQPAMPAPQAAPQAAPQVSAGAELPMEEESNVSPEEQAMYDTVVSNAQNLIYSKDTSTNILNMVQSADNPAEGVAQATVVIGDQLVTKGQEQGIEITDDVLSAAAEEVVEMIFELAEAANIIPEPTDDDMFTALTRSMQLWAEMHPERFNQQEASQDLQGMGKDQVAQVLGQLGV